MLTIKTVNTLYGKAYGVFGEILKIEVRDEKGNVVRDKKGNVVTKEVEVALTYMTEADKRFKLQPTFAYFPHTKDGLAQAKKFLATAKKQKK